MSGTQRFGRNMVQFIKFGMVGGSGVVVNLLVLYVAKKLSWAAWKITEHDAFFNLLGSQFHVRWYHVFMTLAFLVANTWNYQLNRMWTFKGTRMGWLRGFFPFLLTGVMAFVVNLVVLTLLMNPKSPMGLPEHIFDDSTGLRTKFYWASVVAIFVSMPVNFFINKVWTFRKQPKTKIVVESDIASV